MSLAALAETVPHPNLLRGLGDICALRGLGDLSGRLTDLADLVNDDMAELEEALSAIHLSPNLAHRAAGHLLDLGGKRLRPVCVALSARIGSGFGRAARDLAVAVELVHHATLLHDDVVDLGDLRRGSPAA